MFTFMSSRVEDIVNLCLQRRRAEAIEQRRCRGDGRHERTFIRTPCHANCHALRNKIFTSRSCVIIGTFVSVSLPYIYFMRRDSTCYKCNFSQSNICSNKIVNSLCIVKQSPQNLSYEYFRRKQPDRETGRKSIVTDST